MVIFIGQCIWDGVNVVAGANPGVIFSGCTNILIDVKLQIVRRFI